jgi:hypothetical protein
MAVSHLIHNLCHRCSILINQLDEVKQHLSENKDTILFIHHLLTSSSDTDRKANLVGLLVRLHARWRARALVRERFSIIHQIEKIDESLEVIVQIPPSHGL